MPEFVLRVAGRFLRRQFEKGIGRSLAKILTEIITNSNDSYRDLEVKGRRSAKKLAVVQIHFDRARRRFAVVDLAAGMSESEMNRKFGTYGQESGYEGRSGARSLFGKGLRDVLFTQAEGAVRSIKNGNSAIASFKWKKIEGIEQPVVDIRPGPRVTPGLREKWGLLGNGTRVEFTLRDDVHLPQHEKLVERLSSFYMLRPIIGAANRRIDLITAYSPRRIEESPLRYEMPTGTQIDALSDFFECDGRTFQVTGELWQHEEELTQAEEGYEDRDGGLLVLDENDNVLDLTLTPRFDQDLSAARLFGQVRVQGAGTFIREKLNSKTPEEILTETRDGFTKGHPFFKALCGSLEKWLAPHVRAERERRASQGSTLPEDVQRKHARAFEKLSELYEKLVGATPGARPRGPALRLPDKMEFMWPAVTVTTGRTQSVPLVVNLNVVPLGTVISIGDDSDDIAVEPITLTVDGPTGEIKDAFVKSVRVVGQHEGKGHVSAVLPDGFAADLDVSVVDEALYRPADGLAFEPDAYQVHPNERRMLTLWIDLSKVPVGSNISLAASSTSIETASQLSVESRNVVGSDVARVRVPVRGIRLGARASVTATHASFSAAAAVQVTRKPERQNGSGARFKDYEFRHWDRQVPSMLDPEGIVLVNLNDETNRRYFGVDDPRGSVGKSPFAQVRLSELVLTECLQMAVSEAIQNSKLPRKFPDNPETDIFAYVQEQKYMLGPTIHELFVTGDPVAMTAASEVPVEPEGLERSLVSESAEDVDDAEIPKVDNGSPDST